MAGSLAGCTTNLARTVTDIAIGIFNAADLETRYPSDDALRAHNRLFSIASSTIGHISRSCLDQPVGNPRGARHLRLCLYSVFDFPLHF